MHLLPLRLLCWAALLVCGQLGVLGATLAARKSTPEPPDPTEASGRPWTPTGHRLTSGETFWLRRTRRDPAEWTYAESRPESLARFSGFEYCRHLDGSYFDRFVPLDVDEAHARMSEWSPEQAEASQASMTPLDWSPQSAASFDPFRESAPKQDDDPDDVWLPANMQVHVPPSSSSEEQSEPFVGDTEAETNAEPSPPIRATPWWSASSYRKPVQVTTAHLISRSPRFGPAYFVALIDQQAREIYAKLSVTLATSTAPERTSENSSSESESPLFQQDFDYAKRFACYMAADGNNVWSRLVVGKQKLLRYVDGQAYFAPIGIQSYHTPSEAQIGTEAKLLQGGMLQYIGRDSTVTRPSHRIAFSKVRSRLAHLLRKFRDGPCEQFGELTCYLWRRKQQEYAIGRKSHRLAYLLMVHNNFDSTAGVLASILDDYVTILIHVDQKYPEFKQRIVQHVQQLISEDLSGTLKDRLRVMDRSFDGRWGHSSLIHIELEGYFQLMDMNDQWEYVVNLSGYDYPLRYNDAIYHVLKKNYPGRSLIEYFSHTQALDRHEGAPNLGIGSRAASVFRGMMQGWRMSPPYPDWHVYKHHQWMILHRDFVQYLRTSPTAMSFAAFSEFVDIPDESYFATVALNSYEPTRAYADVLQYRLRHDEPIPVHLQPNKPRRVMERMRDWFRRIREKVRKRWQQFRNRKKKEVQAEMEDDGTSVLSPALQRSIAIRGMMSELISNDPKHALHFELGAAHPREIRIRDETSLMEAVAKGNYFYARKLDNRHGQAEIAKRINTIRALDWLRTFACPAENRKSSPAGSVRCAVTPSA